MKKVVCLVSLILATTISGMCTTINFDNQFQLLGKYHSQGLMYWGPGWTFNGVVTTPPNYYREISSDINLYTERPYSHDLFVQVTDVVGGHFGYTTGGVFDALTMVGVEISNPYFSGVTPFYSGMFANPGESLMGDLSGNCSALPLTSTSGWGLASSSSSTFLIQTGSGANNGFTGPWGCIWGTNRILNGGVFMLDFGRDLTQSGNFDVNVMYGYNFQMDHAEPLLTESVPEPATILTMAGGLLACLTFGRRYLSV